MAVVGTGNLVEQDTRDRKPYNECNDTCCGGMEAVLKD
jgi:hypothetical protein